MKKFIMGIDPGKSGGVAVLDIERKDEVFISKVTDMTYLDIANLIRAHKTALSMVYLEHVHAIPGRRMSSSSSFKFGTSYGFYLGVLCALQIPFTKVRPAVWMRAMSCLSKGDKNVTKRKAQELFPGLTITHATADALLIAEYGRQVESIGT